MKLNFNLPILSKSEYHYLIDTEEFKLHPDSNEDSIIVYEYTSSLLEISKELILNNISFEHHVSKDVELSYLIIHNITLDFSLLNTNTN
jgi:hypothetical protein